MKRLDNTQVIPNQTVQEGEGFSADYLKGYRDGIRERDRVARSGRSGDGILGALLAIVLLSGLGYLAWNYATTGRVLPVNIEFTPPEIHLNR